MAVVYPEGNVPAVDLEDPQKLLTKIANVLYALDAFVQAGSTIIDTIPKKWTPKEQRVVTANENDIEIPDGACITFVNDGTAPAKWRINGIASADFFNGSLNGGVAVGDGFGGKDSTDSNSGPATLSIVSSGAGTLRVCYTIWVLA